MNEYVYKRKMCVHFEMKDHSSTEAVIGRQFCRSKAQCMASCTRHDPCNTFHVRSIDGTCELLDTSEICMPHKVTNGTTLVRLSECQKTPPGKVITQAQSKLRRMEPRDVGSRAIITARRIFSNKRQVGRVLYAGIYLYGFVTIPAGEFHALTMEERNIVCSEAFQVLTYAKPADYQLISFAIGDEIPPFAVVGGYWRDGTPLYVIIGYIARASMWKPGFYNGGSAKIYIKPCASKPAALLLLLENNWQKIQKVEALTCHPTTPPPPHPILIPSPPHPLPTHKTVKM